MSDLPVIFLTHGAGPSFFLDANTHKWCKGLDKDSKAAKFFKELPMKLNLSGVKAILVLSAHWEEAKVTVQSTVTPDLYFDYRGFPAETYKLKWTPQGAPDEAKKVMALLKSKGIECVENDERGYDHGVFVPLLQTFPKGEIPVFEVSLLSSMSVSEHLKVGEALSELRREGILIIGSGSATHSGLRDPKTSESALLFQTWIGDLITNPNYSPEERRAKFLESESKAFFSNAHPTLDHYLPIPMTSAAAGYKPGVILHSEFVGSLLNEHYMF